MNDKPAILFGTPMFEKPVNIVSPTLPTLEAMKERIEETLETGMITNFSKYCKEFEKKSAEYFGVKYALSQSNATSGLLILYKTLGLTGEVIVPSFTFSATIHALMWNNLTPVFVDIDKETFNINPKLIEEKITPKTSAILGVHIFGNPCEIEELQKIADKHGLKLIFDSAHAFGSLYKDKKVGNFGNAEVFSLSATKLLTTGEGGVITTNDDKLSEKLCLARNYGDPGTYNCQFIGFNSKLPEYGAIMGLETLKMLEEGIKRRNHIFELFKSELRSIPGITFQKITDNCRTTVKDLAIVIDKDRFGMNRDKLAEALEKENIRTKKYFYPPIHWMKAYAQFYEQYNGKLPNTEYISSNILCLPIYSHMKDETASKICKAIIRIHNYAGEIKKLRKILVTGGAGYVGSVLVEKLLEKGYFVRVLDQLIFGKESLDFAANNPNFELIVGKIEDPYIVEKSMQGIDAVIHLAALSNDPSCDLNPSLTRQTNYEATRSLIDAAKKSKISRFLFASSCSVYGFTGDIVNEESPTNPLTAYSRSKVGCEELILNSATDDFTIVCLRKATIYGPSHRMRFDLVINTLTGSAMSNKKIIINGGKQWRPFIHVEDVADAYIFFLEAPAEKIQKQSFNIGSNEQNYQIETIAEKVKEVIPNIEVEQSGAEDNRSYHVSFDKLSNLGFKTKKTVKEGIFGVKKLFDEGIITNFRDINYYNVKRVISFLNI